MNKDLMMALNSQQIIQTLLAARTRISAAVWLIVRDAQAAEDIFQDVSVKALSADVQFDREPQLVSWAQITARHQALNWLRSRKHRAVTLDESVLELLETEWARETTRPEGERIEALRQCLEELPARSRQMIRLRYFEEQPCREVARALGVKLDAVYQRLTRLHRALGQCIQERLAAEGGTKAEAL
jgi:RNA polymerase sigma-70 factor (ECF subfamily)